MSPFKDLYGKDYITPLSWFDPTIRVEASLQMLEEMEEQTRLIRKEIKAAQDRQKQHADTKRSDRIFKEGDMVFLRVWPKRSSLSLGKYKKLSPQYCGPYTITKRINDQAYQLLLPHYLKVHNVFHVNLLKKYVLDPNHIFEEDELHVTKEGVIEIQPEAILQTRMRILYNRSMNKYLIKWLGYPTDDTTWEREETLLENYPNFMSR